jgi:sec-independent protein translocase protein TatC
MSLLNMSGGFFTGGPADPAMAVMKLAFIAGLFAASPVIAWQIWAFVRAGLYRHERRYVESFAPASFLLFILGCATGYFVLIPYTLYGLASFLPDVAPVYSFSDYLSFVMVLTLVLGAVFQLPLVMVFLSRVGLVPPARWGRWRRSAVAINVILAAVVSPPDVVSMVLFALPLLALYEVGAWASRLAA